jgi:disulfide bond formation protein DsbB
VRRHFSAARLFGAAVLLPLVAVGAALFTQHGLGMQPCAWCVLQRAIFLGISLAALPGLLLRQVLVRRLSALLVLVLAGCGVAAALWQHFVASSSTSCAMSFADRVVRGIGLDELVPEVFTPYASCAEAATAKLLGLPYEFFSMTLFMLLGATAAALLLRSVRR